MKNRLTRIVPLMLFSLAESACVSAVRPDAPPATGSVSAPVIDIAHAATLDQTLQKIVQERLVYVPETHTRNADHLLQLAALKALPADRLALGVEWIQARFQPVLDDFSAGRIDEAEMLRRTDYFNRWGYDYRLYRPIVRYARAHHIPIIALNASRELTDAIRDKSIDGVSPRLRKELPDHYDDSDQAYDRLLKEIFAQHQRKDANFARFREVQLTRDETMAQHITAYLDAHPEKQMLVLAGRGHIAGRHGIPRHVTRRTGIPGVIVSSYDPGLPVRSQADYLVLNDDRPLPPRGLIGALLNIDGPSIVIKGFTPGSAGKEAGLEKDDRIIAVNGQAVAGFSEFKLAMLEKNAGDTVTIRVQRKHLIGSDETLDFDIRLRGQNPSPHGHPKQP